MSQDRLYNRSFSKKNQDAMPRVKPNPLEVPQYKRRMVGQKLTQWKDNRKSRRKVRPFQPQRE